MDFRPEYLAKSSKRGSGYLSSRSLHVIQGKGIEKYAVEACSLKSYALYMHMFLEETPWHSGKQVPVFT